MTIAWSPIFWNASQEPRERRFDLDTIEHHLEVTARKANAVDTAGHLRAGFAEGLGNLTPITSHRKGRGGQSSSEHQT
jgi:hypothetical protein